MNWEAACKHANALAAEGQHVLVVDTIAMPPGFLEKRTNIVLLAVSEDDVTFNPLALAEKYDAIILVTPSRPWCPR